jgi:hypothetical protein
LNRHLGLVAVFTRVGGVPEMELAVAENDVEVDERTPVPVAGLADVQDRLVAFSCSSS